MCNNVIWFLCRILCSHCQTEPAAGAQSTARGGCQTPRKPQVHPSPALRHICKSKFSLLLIFGFLLVFLHKVNICTCLQQVLSSFRGIPIFVDMKKKIEANFKQMKQSLVAEDGCRHDPQLAAHYINWWVAVTQRNKRSWLMQSGNQIFSVPVQDIRNYSKLNIGGFSAARWAYGGPSSSHHLYVPVSVLSQPGWYLIKYFCLLFCCFYSCIILFHYFDVRTLCTTTNNDMIFTKWPINHYF